MKNILSIETSENICSVALGTEKKLIDEKTIEQAHAHNESLGEMVSQLLEERKMTMADISHVFISAGPGSYTGLRIGFSFARGLIYPNNTPLVPIPTPEIYAYKHRTENVKIISVLDARRNEIYVSEYKFVDDKLIGEMPVAIISISNFIEKYASQKILLSGSGTDLIIKTAAEENLSHSWKLPTDFSEKSTAIDLYNYGNELLKAGLETNYNLEEPLYVRDFKGSY